MIIPPALKPGDNILLFAASSRVASHRIETAVAMFQDLGYQVQLQEGLEDSPTDYFAAPTEHCLTTLHQGFADPDIKALIAIRGGYGSMRLLPELDYSLIAANPKIICGFSDVTALLVAINQHTEVVTYHGPMGVTPMTKLTGQYWQSLLSDNDTVEWAPVTDVVKDLPQPQTLCSGTGTGKLIGGNLTLICSMLGTPYLPDTWHDKILFLEDTGEDVYRLDRCMSQLALAGILGQIQGLVLGSFAPYTTKLVGSCTLESMLERYAKRFKIPCFLGALFGHQDDMITLPIGREAKLDANACTLSLLR